MRITIISLFPEWMAGWSKNGVVGRALTAGSVDWSVINPRDYAENDYGQVDDRPFGGGPGMVLQYPPMHRAIQDARSHSPKESMVIATSPQGETFTQEIAQELAHASGLIFVAGRYEGMDERILNHDVDRELSVGDYVLSGGELAALVMADAIVRLVPGVLGEAASLDEESFNRGRLDCPHYTRPEHIEGSGVAQDVVPPVLLSGDHAAIARWRRKQQVGRTVMRRPDLVEAYPLDPEEKTLLSEYLAENRANPTKTDQ